MMLLGNKSVFMMRINSSSSFIMTSKDATYTSTKHDIIWSRSIIICFHLQGFKNNDRVIAFWSTYQF